MAPDNDDTRRSAFDGRPVAYQDGIPGPVPVASSFEAGPRYGGDCDGLPRDWLEGVTLDYYWVMDPGTLQGPFGAPLVRR